MAPFYSLTLAPFLTLITKREPLTMDWDEHDADRNVAVIPQRRRRATAA